MPATEGNPAQLPVEILSDWRAHSCDWTRPGFRAVAVHRFGVWRNTLRFKPVRAPLSILYRILYRHCRNVYGIEIPITARIGHRVVFEHQHGIVIHPEAVIGDDCIIHQGATLGNRHHNVQCAPVLGKRVNVGAGAKLLGEIHIGDDATIGANAVVMCDVPARATAVGVPARIICAKLPDTEALGVKQMQAVE